MKVKKFKNGKVSITLENQNEINLIKSYFGASPCYVVEKAFNLKQVLEYYITSSNLTFSAGNAVLPTDLFLVDSIFDDDVEYYQTICKAQYHRVFLDLVSVDQNLYNQNFHQVI